MGIRKQAAFGFFLGAMVLGLAAVGGWWTSHVLSTGVLERRGHVTIERSTNPVLYWTWVVQMIGGAVVFGVAGLSIIYGAYRLPANQRRLDRHLLAKIERREPPPTSTLLD